MNHLVIRNPSLGDSLTIEVQRILRDTIDGEQDAYRDSSWPKTRKYKFTYTPLSEAQAEALQTFVTANLGVPIEFNDAEGNLLEGVITTPEAELIEIGNCNFAVSLEFLCL